MVGASAIAVSPVSPVVPSDFEAPTAVTRQVQLIASVNPIEAYAALVQNTVGSIAGLGQAVLANPAPILRQIITNQLATAGAVLEGLQTFGGDLVNNLQTIAVPALRDAFAALAAGNFVGAAPNLVTALVQPLLFAALPLLPVLQAALEQPAANLLAVTQQFQTIAALAGIGALSPLSSTIYATAQAIQNVADAATAGDPIGAIGALIAAPALVIDGFLNGYGADAGLLSPGLGPIGALLQIRDIIANAITPTSTVATTLPEAGALPDAAAASVTLSTSLTDSEDAGLTSTQASDTAGESTDPGPKDEAGGAALADDAADEEGEAAGEVTEETEEGAGDDSEAGDGTTDLSDGNKVEPGDTVADDASSDDGAGDGSGEEATTRESAGDADADGGSDAGADSGDTGGGSGGGDSGSGGGDSGTE